MRRDMKERWWCRLWAARDGLGAIEFGFIAPVLALMLLGVLDFGMAFWQQMEIANAADAGAQWGMANPYNATSITTVAQSATSLGSTANVTPSNTCGCVNSTTNTITTGYGSPGSCTACPAGSVSSTASNYIVVDAQICFKPVFPSWPPSSLYGGDGCASNAISLKAQSFVLK